MIGSVVGPVQKIDKAKAAVIEKEKPGETGFACHFEPGISNAVKAEKYLHYGKIHGKHVSVSQGSSKEINTGGDTVTEKRIAELTSRRNRIKRWKCLLFCDTCNKTKVHIHITEGTLPGVKTIIFRKQGMTGKHDAKNKEGDST